MPIIKIIGAEEAEFNADDITTLENKIKKAIVDIKELEITEDHVVVYFMGPRNHAIHIPESARRDRPPPCRKCLMQYVIPW